MLFTMPIDKTVATRVGHTIEFKKGVPTHVPKEAWREVQAAGAVPEDQEAVQPKGKAAAVVVDDPVERRARIHAAFASMVETNKRGDFGASGYPALKALEKAVGFEVDDKERDTLWNEFQQLPPVGSENLSVEQREANEVAQAAAGERVAAADKTNAAKAEANRAADQAKDEAYVADRAKAKAKADADAAKAAKKSKAAKKK